MNEIITYRVTIGEQVKDFQTLVEAQFYRDQSRGFGWTKTPIIRIVTQVLSYSIVLENDDYRNQQNPANKGFCGWGSGKTSFEDFGKEYFEETADLKRPRNQDTVETNLGFRASQDTTPDIPNILSFAD